MRKVTLAVEDKEIPIESIIIPEMPFPPLPEEAIEKIKKTIVKYGLVYKPVVIPMNGGKYYLVDGRNRLNALMKLGYKTVPVTVINALPEEGKALHYVIECFRRHLTEKDREEAEQKLEKMEKDVIVQIKEKIKSFLTHNKIPKGVVSHIIKNLPEGELSTFYLALKENKQILIPVLETTLTLSKTELSDSDISQTQNVIEELKKENAEFEKEKAELERKLKELQEKEEAYKNHINRLEEEIALLESELEKIKTHTAEVANASQLGDVSLDDPRIKALVEQYVQEKIQERVKEEADKLVKIALKNAMTEQAELERKLKEIINERNKYLRERNELAEKLQEFEKKSKILNDKLRTQEDSVRYLRNLLMNVVSIDAVLEEFDIVIMKFKTIYTTLMTLKGLKSHLIQENHVFSLESKFEEAKGHLHQIEKVINDIKNVMKSKTLDEQA